jgi:Putative Actinobacterial Holin-X, holin superfamily III
MRSTIDLLLDLVRQGQALARVELSLVRKELSERSGLVVSSLIALAAGLILLPVGLGLIIVACALLLTRLGVPLDLAFLILALAVIVVGLVLVWLGVRGLRPSRLIPAKSISQISSLFGGLEP